MGPLVLSLFPGLGLLDRAFQEEGFCVVSGPDKLLGGDVHDFHPPAGRFVGVIGGSPCQAFSPLINLVRLAALRRRKLYAVKEGDVTHVYDANRVEQFAGSALEVTEWLGIAYNLVPEFERVVLEASPAWFLHENVPRAPIPRPAGYAVQDFEICNSSIEGEDGLGQEQERVRRFAFGVGGSGPAPNLLRWIPRTALRLPAASRTGAVSQTRVDNSPEAKGRERVGAVSWTETPGQRQTTKSVLDARTRVSAVVADAREVPVALGGSGKLKARLRQPPLTGENGTKHETPRTRQPTVEGGNPTHQRPKGRHGNRRTIGEMLRLQGLPEDLLDGAPYTSRAKRKLIANGVPMPLGRAVARAVRKALEI